MNAFISLMATREMLFAQKKKPYDLAACARAPGQFQKCVDMGRQQIRLQNKANFSSSEEQIPGSLERKDPLIGDSGPP